MKQIFYKILCKVLKRFTRIYLWRTKPFAIGITGSVGKTCCRDILTQVLQQVQRDKIVYTSPKNYNSELGLIFSIFQIEHYDPSIINLLKITLIIGFKSLFQKKTYDILVAEYGIDSPGDMDFLVSVMKPDISILTKLDSVHSDNFPNGIREYWRDKWKLLFAAKQEVFFNSQDSFSLENENLISKPYTKIFNSEKNIQFDISDSVVLQKFTYNKKPISINLLGDENVEYTRLGLMISEKLGIKLSDTQYNFRYSLQSGRFNIFQRNENIFIDSSYNAGPESMKKIIGNTQTLQKQLYSNYEIIYVLGDMREIGEALIPAHESLVSIIEKAAAVFTVGPYMYEYMIPKLKTSSFHGEIHSSLSAREIGEKLKKYLKDNREHQYIILFKGSQNTIFTEEALAPQLLKSQQKHLPRQSENWKAKKDIFFESL